MKPYPLTLCSLVSFVLQAQLPIAIAKNTDTGETIFQGVLIGILVVAFVAGAIITRCFCYNHSKEDKRQKSTLMAVIDRETPQKANPELELGIRKELQAEESSQAEEYKRQLTEQERLRRQQTSETIKTALTGISISFDKNADALKQQVSAKQLVVSEESTEV